LFTSLNWQLNYRYFILGLIHGDEKDIRVLAVGLVISTREPTSHSLSGVQDIPVWAGSPEGDIPPIRKFDWMTTLTDSFPGIIERLDLGFDPVSNIGSSLEMHVSISNGSGTDTIALGNDMCK